MKIVCERTYWEVDFDSRHRSRPTMPEILPEWLVSLSPVRQGEIDRSMVDVVIVHGRDDLCACRAAFDTRNIPDNWVIVEIENEKGSG